MSREPELRLLLERGQKMCDQMTPTSEDVATLVTELDAAKSKLHRLHDRASDKNTKLKEASKRAGKFYDDLETMLAWLSLNGEKIGALPDIGLDRTTTAKQLKEAQTMQGELKRKARALEELKSSAETLMSISSVNKEAMNEQLVNIGDKLKNLSQGQSVLSISFELISV